ncbi:AAA family ATPase [Alcanivorax sp. 1008]|uniref:AAA family ATPase n=1 Tax=Alcanivorax sp. 1008 TaxID=2816853 RepID=UPI001DAF8520|nr:AAA family ATPase [Alcanivorax sp. 1008]MCC1497950.1 AAA family ATPase [Alcanivorax sp. 1008]
MRILQVRFKNLNSLAGEWEVDLTHPDYDSNGIFAITGPTGAGKTTILDAICLALYGRTPRLNKITKSLNEIMSRQTGDCFAEVTFETQAGRFRCHWSQHRARKKADGELQAPKHEISNADTGEIYESKLRGVAEEIETATGMDFDRFTRSMLLAQGGFSAFLQAAADERAPILEQITGTEIYSQISIRVHEKLREERDKLKLLEAESSGVMILEPEEEAQIDSALQGKVKEEAELQVEFDAVGRSITWLASIDNLRKEIANLATDESQLQNDFAAFKPEQEILNKALKAHSLDGAYATIDSIRNQQQEDIESLRVHENALPEQESSVTNQAEILKVSEKQTKDIKEEIKTSSPIIKQVRTLDHQIDDQRKAVKEINEHCSELETKIEQDKQKLLGNQEKREALVEELGQIEEYLKDHSEDEWLVSGLAGVEAQFTDLLNRQGDIQKNEQQLEAHKQSLDKAKEALAACSKLCADRKQELDSASKSLKESRDNLERILNGKLLREYRSEKEALLREITLLKTIASLEDHRNALKDGEACPLCGATDHPFAEGNIPTPDESENRIRSLTELIEKAEAQEHAIKQLELNEATARSNLVEAEKQEFAANSEKSSFEKSVAEAISGIEKIRTEYSGIKDALIAKLKPLGFSTIPDDKVSLVIEELMGRLDIWQTKVKESNEFERQAAELDSDKKSLDAIISTQVASLNDQKVRLDKAKNALATREQERIDLYGDKSPDVEEARMNEGLAGAEEAERQARIQNDELKKTLNSVKTQIEALQKRIAGRVENLKSQEESFLSKILGAGFADEAEFLSARLDEEKREALSGKSKSLEERKTQLIAKQKDREERLAKELTKNITTKTFEELEPQKNSLEKSLSEVREIIAGFKHKLDQNKNAKEKLKEKQEIMEAQKSECRRWDNLHELIGSADGKKYRNFAQGLTFEIMISHANKQLQKMSDRYLLVRDAAQPLELNVVDNYQAGETRSTKNLSGGESFIVSLSLALGLSNMASKNVRVDSLFLDEGFGTLDEEALDVALETLSGLQQEGKLIGIISHVQALKERIGTQIQVSPHSGGRSVISGSGVSRLQANEL